MAEGQGGVYKIGNGLPPPLRGTPLINAGGKKRGTVICVEVYYGIF